MSFNETRDSFEDIFVCNGEVVDEIHKDMVAIRVSVLSADDFECVQNARNQTICLGDKVFRCAHGSSQTTRPNKCSDEEPVVELIFSCDGLIYVDLLRLSEARSEFVVRQTTEFQLEGKGRFDITNSLFFAPYAIHFAECVVERILSPTA